jgi:hypothetical protein
MAKNKAIETKFTKIFANLGQYYLFYSRELSTDPSLFTLQENRREK